ncbi:DUF1826 domain-containing protein [Pseudomonas atacamensis]
MWHTDHRHLPLITTYKRPGTTWTKSNVG